LEVLDGAVAAGATAMGMAERMGISLRTLQRWRRQFAAHDASGGAADGGGGGGGGGDPAARAVRATCRTV
jgi:transposase-like protein